MVHPYLQFRLRMARYGLRQFLASLANSLEITLLGFGPVLIGLAAAIALPGMMAVTLGWPAMLAILAAQALFAALPTVLLRKRLHPADAVVWARPLPVPPALAWAADALSAGLIAGPLAGLYAVSAMIWLYQWPDWLRPVAPQAIAATLLSLLLGWALATLALARRRLRAALPARRRARAAAATPAAATLAPGTAPAALAPGYTPRPLRPLLPALWHRLFWLPFWRAENHVGLQQCVLLAGALGCTTAWLLGPPLGLPLPGAAMGGLASAMLILLTDRGDKAVREQTALLRPVLAPWPLDTARLLLCARLFSLIPGAAVLAAFAVLAISQPQAWGHEPAATAPLAAAAPFPSPRAALVWLAAAGTACAAIVALNLGPRGRVVLVVLSILILTAIGSEF
ncbi:hypothetical protein [Pseudoduganella sp. UC29_71]|uniref:hypothetical protein n=1 Tax=Pseudoduganella sp. UC29_71 TaxID=3350174 RepID=UPI00366E603C